MELTRFWGSLAAPPPNDEAASSTPNCCWPPLLAPFPAWHVPLDCADWDEAASIFRSLWAGRPPARMGWTFRDQRAHPFPYFITQSPWLGSFHDLLLGSSTLLMLKVPTQLRRTGFLSITVFIGPGYLHTHSI